MEYSRYYFKFAACVLVMMQVCSSAYLKAQDYLISFVGSGGSSTVNKVKVENLTQWKSLEMNGSDVLHLKSVVTGIESVLDSKPGRISFYPNPMKDYTRMQFDLPVSGETTVILYDFSGRSVAQTRDLLYQGSHTYLINGLDEGFYFVRLNCSQYSTSGRLISSGSQNRNAKIVYENSGDQDTKMASEFKEAEAKGTYAETVMQYTTGDWLKFTGISGNYSTVVTDIPATSKTITFNLIACTDGDNNHYPTVTIGTQTWMADNLKTTKYNDGTTSIPLVADNTAWAGLTDHGYCWYGNDEAANKNIYGGIYNWYTGAKGNLCPTGWHMPLDADWATLNTFLGGTYIAGKKLKETGVVHWQPINTATNESGFTALPGGWRSSNGTFNEINVCGEWWTVSEKDATTAWSYYLELLYDRIYRESVKKTVGFSVRCIKD